MAYRTALALLALNVDLHGQKDPVRLHVVALRPESLSTMLKLLTGNPAPATIPAEENLFLYQCAKAMLR